MSGLLLDSGRHARSFNLDLIVVDAETTDTTGTATKTPTVTVTTKGDPDGTSVTAEEDEFSSHSQLQPYDGSGNDDTNDDDDDAEEEYGEEEIIDEPIVSSLDREEKSDNDLAEEEQEEDTSEFAHNDSITTMEWSGATKKKIKNKPVITSSASSSKVDHQECLQDEEEQEQQKRRRQTTKVRFGVVQVHYHKIELGNSSFCMNGPPITLGQPLEGESEVFDSPSAYEEQYHRWSSSSSGDNLGYSSCRLRVPPSTRRTWLLQAGYSNAEIIQCRKELRLERERREKGLKRHKLYTQFMSLGGGIKFRKSQR